MAHPAENYAESQAKVIIEDEDEVIDESESFPTIQEHQRSTQSSKFTTFTLDDIPPSKWRQQFQEVKAWILVEAQRPIITTKEVIISFVSRFTGILQDWWNNQGE